MKYTILGTIEDQEVRVTWNDGEIEGDPQAVDELLALAMFLEGKAVGPEPEGPFTYRNHLSDPLSTLVLIEDVLDDITRRQGDFPTVARKQRAA